MSGPVAVAVDFRVVDEAAGWIVVDKPAPLLVHPVNGTREPTLLGGLEVLLGYEIVNGARLSVMTRLDRETSGLVLVAKRRDTAREFTAALMAREVRKEYLAVVHGWPEWRQLRVDAPVRRLGEVAQSAVWLRQCVAAGGRDCVTFFQVEQLFEWTEGKFALVRCVPETGRTHQLRVHLEHLGHPLVGDKIYGGDGGAYLDFIANGWSKRLARQLLLPRHGLHATRLEVPWHGGRLGWDTPLAADLREFLARGSEVAMGMPGR